MATNMISACVLLIGSMLMADDGVRVLFEFTGPGAVKQWKPVNDGVMGGRSDGRFSITDEKSMKFFGNLSLANNGGFASVRSNPTNLGLRQGDSIVTRIRGDGREYNLNLYVPRNRVAFSYRATFTTKMGEWIEVQIPLNDFVATSFGQVVTNAGPVQPGEVNSIGFLLGDKKPGPFALEVQWIKAVVDENPR